LEGGTKEEIQIFKALFEGVSTRFGLRIIEKYIENPDFLFSQSFQNLRLGSIKLYFQEASCVYPNGYGEQKIAQFRTHDLTTELACVSTQQSGQFDTFLFNHFSVH
jgi:hypothetical protein